MREVRIKDTSAVSRRPWTLPGGGIYACGPPSTAASTSARPPFVVFSLLARFLRSEGYEARLVVNVPDVNDKIYDAAREPARSRRPSPGG